MLTRNFESVSAELRQVSGLHQPSLKQKIFDTLMGSTIADEGSIQHASIFDLFDFVDLYFSMPAKPTVLDSFEDIDLSVCLEPADDSLSYTTWAKSKTSSATTVRNIQG